MNVCINGYQKLSPWECISSIYPPRTFGYLYFVCLLSYKKCRILFLTPLNWALDKFNAQKNVRLQSYGCMISSGFFLSPRCLLVYVCSKRKSAHQEQMLYHCQYLSPVLPISIKKRSIHYACIRSILAFLVSRICTAVVCYEVVLYIHF